MGNSKQLIQPDHNPAHPGGSIFDAKPGSDSSRSSTKIESILGARMLESLSCDQRPTCLRGVLSSQIYLADNIADTLPESTERRVQICNANTRGFEADSRNWPANRIEESLPPDAPSQ
jgi:hypothetical protein